MCCRATLPSPISLTSHRRWLCISINNADNDVSLYSSNNVSMKTLEISMRIHPDIFSKVVSPKVPIEHLTSIDSMDSRLEDYLSHSTRKVSWSSIEKLFNIPLELIKKNARECLGNVFFSGFKKFWTQGFWISPIDSQKIYLWILLCPSQIFYLGF